MEGDSKGRARPGFVSAQNVADRAGVSRSAVSRAFTPGASISARTRERVMQGAAELGYQVNDLARSLLTNRSRLVGLVATRPEVGFRAHLASALTKALIRRGNVPILINTGDSQEDMLAAQRTLFGYRAEATIVLSGSPPASFVDLARRNGQPLVVLGRADPDLDHIIADNAAAARSAAKMFFAAGARRFGVAGADTLTPSVVEREAAFVAEVERLGGRLSRARGPQAEYRGGLAAARHLMQSASPPQAIFAVNDQIAFGVLDYLRLTAGLRVPQDVAVIGFDDVPEADWSSFALTTFRQDPDIMAKAAVKLLERRLRAPAIRPQGVRLPSHLVVRRSFLPVDAQTAKVD